MKRPQELFKDIKNTRVLSGITDIFEGIASMRIAQIKNQVLQSQGFFSELWNMYTQIYAGSEFSYGRRLRKADVIDKELYIAITAEGSFSGDIDQKLISWMLESYDKQKNDIIVIGHHGTVQLTQRGVSFKKYFKLPSKDQNINVMPIIKEIQNYRSSIVFYQTYVSLTVQDVKRISISTAVKTRSEDVVRSGNEIIDDTTYIFEPSTFAVIDHLERSMMNIALTQVILESKLAQYASRFQAMTKAHERAGDELDDLKNSFSRSKRAIKDERLKEIVNGLRKAVHV
jgi:F-type H+-transporting ATPase subunit gamma